MKLLSIALVAVALAAAVARADEATARVTYKQAEDLRKAGKWADACPLYAASYKDDPQLGVLLHLAECHEKIGKIATAWSEFSDAAELGHEHRDPRESAARAAADALAPRLPKLHVVPAATAVPGLVVLRDGVDITVLVGQDIPVDPGEHVIVARAPGYAEAKLATIVHEGATSQLTLPALKPLEQHEPVAAPVRHDTRLEVKAPPDAHIMLDTVELGVGHFAGNVTAGGHQLRVTAPGMLPYQSEILISEGTPRAIEVTLEHAPAAAVISAPAAPEPEVPRYGGVRIFGGVTVDGLSSQVSNCSGGTGIYCGSGPRDAGVQIGGRARVNFSGQWSFDPGLALHFRSVYLEHCSPCMQTGDLSVTDVEAFAMFRYGLVASKLQVSLLAGPFFAARFTSNDFAVPSGQPMPDMGRGKLDLGPAFALELFYKRIGAQLQVIYGTQQVSSVVDVPLLSLGASLGFRI